MKKYICKQCNEEFETFQAKANHVRWKHTDNTNFLKKSKEIAKKSNEKRFGKWINETIECSKNTCNNQVYIKYREGKKKDKYFCSRSCANSRGPRTSEFKKQVGLKIKKAWEEGLYDNIDYSNNKNFSSKNERLIVDYFKKHFKDDEWASGGRLIYDSVPIVRDLYSDKLKVCFEYDGIWHFKDIHGQLEHKQNVDFALEKWCLENDYRLIRIDEIEFESCKQIEELIYHMNDPIIKIGHRYKNNVDC